MEYRGVLELQIRTYEGVMDGIECWTFNKYAIGIITDEGIYDYKTGEEYDVIFQQENLKFNATKDQLERGKTYGLAFYPQRISLNSYRNVPIDKYVKRSVFYEEEYKKMKAYPFNFKKTN